jgi:UDP-glucose 4-epimerase
MKVLVTGAAGFIGSHVCDMLVERGHDVVGVDDFSSGQAENVHPSIRFIALDITSPEMEGLIAKERPAVVMHHAAQIDVRRSVEDPVFDLRVNLAATVALARTGLGNGLTRMVFASTGGAIYGEQQAFPATEDHPTNPVSPYGCAKLAAEKYLDCFGRLHGLEVVALRYSNVYGPRQSPHGEAGVVAIFTQAMLEGKSPSINGDGLQTRDYVYVGDVVHANLLALETPFAGVYNIGTGAETTVNEIFHRLRVLTGASVEEVHGPAKPGEQRRSSVSPAKAQRYLNWTPNVDLATGLAITVDFFRARRRR